MYNLLLVDDENEVRSGIRQKMPWDDLGFQVVGEANNGLEALEMCETLHIDLVMTDIKMPYMDGLALSKILIQERPWVQILLLTGFDYLDFQREIKALGLTDFLLKPVDSNTITKVLKDIKQRLDHHFNSCCDALHNHKAYLKRDKRVYDGPLLEALTNSAFNLPSLFTCDYQLAIIGTPLDNPLTSNEWLGIANYIETHILESFDGYVVYDEKQLIVMAPLTDHSKKTLNIALKILQHTVMHHNGIGLVIGLSDVQDTIKSLSTAYSQGVVACTWGRDLYQELKCDCVIHYQDYLALVVTADVWIETIKEQIHNGYESMDLSVESLSKTLNVTTCFLSTLFKTQMGIRVIDYIMAYRIKKAQTLLETTKLKQYEIAKCVGFEATHVFVYWFRKCLHISPKDYRKSLKGFDCD